jgi:hypothetical protein
MWEFGLWGQMSPRGSVFVNWNKSEAGIRAKHARMHGTSYLFNPKSKIQNPKSTIPLVLRFGIKTLTFDVKSKHTLPVQKYE